MYAGARSGDQVLDDWQELEVVYGDGKTFNPGAGDMLLITDEKHRMRSLAADQATVEEVSKRPLPPAATNPANVSQNPTTAVARGITRGPVVTVRAPTLIRSLACMRVSLRWL